MKNSARKPVREEVGIDAIIEGQSLVLVLESLKKYRLKANLSQAALAVKLAGCIWKLLEAGNAVRLCQMDGHGRGYGHCWLKALNR